MSSSPPHSLSAGDIAAAEELELSDEPLDEITIDKEKTDETPQISSSLPRTSPIKTPSKVKAAAAMWGKPSPIDGTKPTSPASFRSIPASSSKASIPSTSLTLMKTRTPRASSSSPQRTIGTEPSTVNPTDKAGKAGILPVEPWTTTAGSEPMESPTVVSLDEPEAGDPSRVDRDGSQILSPSPNPPSSDAGDTFEEIDVDVKASPKPKPSFFATTLGFGSSVPSSSATFTSPKPSRSTSATSNGTGWRSTMSNILGSRPSATPSPGPSSATQPSSPPPPPLSVIRSPQGAALRSASTGFIVSRIESPVASRDRRISRQDGGDDKLREGFERVRIEMEDAAREMRKEDKSESAEQRLSSSNVDWTFWGAVVQDYEEVARERPRELSRAIQQGIPPVIRGAIWQLMSSSKSSELEETYKALLKTTSSHEKAIAKDINRTFPNHKFFQEGGGVGQESLFMVVKAYSLYDEDVGYTQGLAFIVAALLLNMPDEEAFCVLVRLMDSYNLRSLFLADMPGLQLRLFQFDRLVEEILPLVHTHFIKKGVKSSMFASQWFMTLFSYRFPLSLVYRVLDIVFAEGIEAIFRFSLALVCKSEDKIVELGFEQILQFLQTDLFQVYRRQSKTSDSPVEAHALGDTSEEEGEWRANEFVRDAYEVRITPFMLDSYEAEYNEVCRNQNRHALELDQLRNANRSLSLQVKQLEASLATMNQEHVELVRQLVMSKIDKEDTENELVRYKMLYAEMAHAQQDAMSTHSRFSGGSTSIM